MNPSSDSDIEHQDQMLNVSRILRARGHGAAVNFLERFPFCLMQGTNSFGDEFSLLFAEVSLPDYENFRVQSSQIEVKLAFKEIADVFIELGNYIRFIVVDLKRMPTSATGKKRMAMTDDNLIKEINGQREIMIHVATGQEKIQIADDDYRKRRQLICEGLRERGVEDPNPYSDLWRWYEKWKSGDLPTYQSRRRYISDMYDPLIDRLHNRSKRGLPSVGSELYEEPTGWVKVDRQLDNTKAKLETGTNEEDYQTVGLLCREVLISLAQAVYNPQVHISPDGIVPSETDAKRMLEIYISVELRGGATEEARRYAKAALDSANSLQHRRTAEFRAAAMCAEATISVVNLVAIISGRRDPT